MQPTAPAGGSTTAASKLAIYRIDGLAVKAVDLKSDTVLEQQ